METFECICSRRSCEQFKDEGIEREKLGRILEAGRHAPSPGNVQSWEFVVIEDPEKKDALAEIVRDERVKTAAADIVICSNLQKSEREFGERGIELYSIQETAAAVQNILLESHNQGLGTFWTSDFNEENVSDLIRSPKKIRPLAVVAIGYAKKFVKPTRKYKITELSYLDEYGNRISPNYNKFEWEGIMKFAKKLRRDLRS